VGPGVAGRLQRVVVERRDLVGTHAVSGEPGRDVDAAKLDHVGEHLVGPGAADRARGGEGVTDQHDAGLPIAGADIEIGWPDLDVAFDRKVAGDPGEPRQRGVQGLDRGAPERAQPGIVRMAVGEEIGAHPASDRKQRDVGGQVARPFGKIGQPRKREGGTSHRREIESDRDRVAGADDLALDAERAAQPDIQSVGEHHEAR